MRARRVELHRHPEVGQVGVLVLGDQDVAGLDVAVHEPASVRRVERPRHLRDDRERPPRLQRPGAAQERAQIAALDVAHGQERRPLSVAGVIDRDDVRVIERGRDPRLAQEALPERVLVHKLGRQDLQRHLALQPLVLGEVHRAHRPAPDHRLDAVSRENAPYEIAHRSTLLPCTVVREAKWNSRFSARCACGQTTDN